MSSYPGFEIRCGRVCYHGVDVLTEDFIKMTSNFQSVDGVRYYKNQMIEQVIEGLENGKYDVKDFPQWNKRFGHWCYGTRDVLTDETLLLSGQNFVLKHDVEFILDRSYGEYVPWENMKKVFALRLETIVGFESYLQPIFITKDSPENCGHAAFDQNLMEQNIDWFAYIKFYIDGNESIRPLVVGKSVTRSVNSSGTDLSFSMKQDDRIQ